MVPLELEGLVASMVYIGVVSGSFASDPIGDMHGRRAGCCGWNPSGQDISVDFSMLCRLQTLVGASMGSGQLACRALLTETTPANGRVVLPSLDFCLRPPRPLSASPRSSAPSA
ncbi:unnamed protein product, partial [Prorocentrum cordatum]